MDLGEAVIAVGLGFRKACTAETLVELVRRALGEAGGVEPTLLATIAEKDRPALREAARTLGLPVRIMPKSAMASAEDRITMVSARAKACFGIPSVAEAAALAAAGPAARLIVSRMAAADATCAIASDSP